MDIIILRDDFLRQLFPDSPEPGNEHELLQYFRTHYQVGGYIPEITLKEDVIIIHADESEFFQTNKQLQKIIQFSSDHKYDEAKKLLGPIIKNGTYNSEIYRIYGQILSEEGTQEEALNQFIDALRFNPKNTHALLMLGNIYARYFNDKPAALVFFQRILEIEPENYLALNNIGGTLAEIGNLTDAKHFFEKALQSNPNYTNAHLGLAILAQKANNLLEAFQRSIDALKSTNNKEAIFKNCFNKATKCARDYAQSFNMQVELTPLIQQLAEKGRKEVKLILDNSISTPAKLELAEVHKVRFHAVKYKQESLTLPHLIIHELHHLQFIIEARKQEENKFFATQSKHKAQFIADVQPFRIKLKKGGISDENAHKFLDSLFSGITNQLYNAPIDLFIEDEIHQHFKTFRPIQFLSLMQLLGVALEGANSKQIIEFTPPNVYRGNVTMSLTHAFHLQELYGVDMLDSFNSKARAHIKLAQKLYAQFKEMQPDREPGEEYDLIDWWGEDLTLKSYYELLPEKGFSSYTADNILDAVIEDPFDINNPEKDATKWVKSQSPTANEAVVMYCLSALQYIKDKSPQEIKQIGFEIAMMGRQGFNTNNSEKIYHFANVPRKDFSGLEALAWMPTTWQQIDNTVDIGADFKKEYELAKELI